MSDPRLTAAQKRDALIDQLLEHGLLASDTISAIHHLRADVDRLTAERDALQQRILGMEDRLQCIADKHRSSGHKTS